GSAHPGEDRQGAYLQQRKSRFDGYFHGRPLPGARTLRRLRGRIEKNLLLQAATSAQRAGKEPATGWFRPDYSNGGRGKECQDAGYRPEPSPREVAAA